MQTLFGALLLALLAISPLQAEENGGGLEARALVAAERQATLSAQLAARIEAIPVDVGDRFQRSAPLVVFDCKLEKAERAKLLMGLEAAREIHAANRRLMEFKSISEVEAAVSGAREKEARAQVAVAEARIALCVIAAPFDGRVVKRLANPHEYVTPGQPVLEILEDRALRLELLVPSLWGAWLKRGAPFTVRIEETGRAYAARVRSFGARIDPVSQTLEVWADLDSAHDDLLSGMSGVARFDKPTP